MKFARKLAATALVALALASPASAQDTSAVKLALIDGQSGPNGFIGESMRQHLQFFAERQNAAGGVLGGKKLDVIAFDNKFDPQETIVQLQKAIDAGARYVFTATVPPWAPRSSTSLRSTTVAIPNSRFST